MIRFFRRRRGASLRAIINPVLRRRVRARAEMLADLDERYFSSEWLARPDVFCVAQENDIHGLHDDCPSLADAIARFPDTRWFMASTYDGRARDMIELTDPLAHLVATERHISLPALWTVAPFMLFSVEQPAAILYTHGYEFKLISGSAEFVRAYIDGAEEDPVDELREWSQGNIEWRNQVGHEEAAVGIQRTLDIALSQVKLPPPNADSQSYEVFCRELARRVPALAPILEGHLKDQDELLAYIFLSDAAEWAEENAVTRKSDVAQLLAVLNQGLAEGERNVPNLIVVGFVEWLLRDTPLKPLLQGDLKGWYEFQAGIAEEHPYLRRGGK